MYPAVGRRECQLKALPSKDARRAAAPASRCGESMGQPLAGLHTSVENTRLLENPRQSDGGICMVELTTPLRMPRIREVILMHPLRLFFAAWLALGTATVFFLFWLCKRTAERINILDQPVLDQPVLDQPVLDQDTFQQLLAAAYALQEQNPQPVEETKADSSRRVSLPLGSARVAQYDVERLASLNHSVVASARYKGVPQSDAFFWRVATAAAMAAIFALLLVASTHRLSPLPAGLVVQQQEPLRSIVTKAVVMEPQATKTGPSQRTVDADKSGRSATAPIRKINLTRHSIYESEADMVAPDTVMRYGSRPAAR